MTSYSPFKTALKRDLPDAVKEIENYDPQTKKVAEGLRIFQSIVQERDTLLASCATLSEDLKFAREHLQRTEDDLAEMRRQRDHYLKLLAAYSAQAQILYDTSSAMMAKINTVSHRSGDDVDIKALASRLGAKSENGKGSNGAKSEKSEQ